MKSDNTPNPSLTFALCIFIIVNILSITPLILLYRLGYKPLLTYNQNAVKINCTIYSYDIMRVVDCYFNVPKVTYDGIINISHTTQDFVYSKPFSILDNEPDVYSCRYDLEKLYPLYSNITCYYQRSNPQDITLQLKSTDTYSFFFIVFNVIYIGILIISSCCVTINCFIHYEDRRKRIVDTF